MQSLNEELQTVNAELQGRLDELSLANNDTKNLLNSTEVATLFLDKELNIRRYTSEATKIIKLIPGDVGRSITDLASALIYPERCDDVREVLRKPRSAEKPVRTLDGRWFSVRIMPYRTLSDHVDGVVITFGDITESKTLENRLQEMQIALQDRLDGKSSELVKAKDALKAQRGRSRKT